jgi:sugar lactone lactonase YvrE
MRKIKLFLFSLLVLGTTHAQTLSYKHSAAGRGYYNVAAEINGYLTTSQQTVIADFHSNIVDYNNNWTGTANYDYFVNNTLVGSSTNPNLTVDLSAYIPVTSVRIVTKASNWSTVIVTLTVTPTVALTAGPTVSNVSYIKYTTAPPLTATLTGGNVALKWYTSSLGEGYSSTPPTPSTATVGTTTYYVSQANSSGVESARSMITVTINPVPAPSISYATPHLYTVGTAITNLTPTNTGGVVPGSGSYIYSVSPALPAGLSINPTTGVISGTPTQVSAATNYTITATNEGGSGSAVVNIRVKAQAPNISYASPQLYTVGTAITALSPNNTGGEVPGTSTYIYSVSPALPSGLSINATTGVISGTPTQVSATANYTITASNESGSSTAVVNIRVKAQAPNISYTTPHVYMVGTPIASLMPSNTGGEIPGTSTYIYSSATALPAGLNLNAATGEITGTPTEVSAATNYTITANNESGSSTAVVNIRVTSLAPSISFSAAQQYTVGVAIAPLSPINLGGAVPASGSAVATFAGGSSGYQDGAGSAASFNYAYGLGTDADDNVYVADQYNHAIRKITPDGNVTTIAGAKVVINEIEYPLATSVDGTGTEASFNTPMGVAVDNDGNIFVAEQFSSKIRKITPAGVTTTFAGSGIQGMDDGIGTAASFSQPIAVALSNDGNTLFVADYINNVIRKVITSTAEVSIFAGTGASGSDDGAGTTASFNGATGLVVDAAGNVFVADQSNNKIRKITAAGVVSTFAGSGNEGAADGQGTAASFNSPTGIAIDGAGNLYVADQYNYSIRKITPTGLVSTIAGNGTDGAVNGLGSEASFSSPTGVAVDSKGNLYVADGFNHSIRKISLLGYSIKPALPAGLIFDTATGEISGTPTESRAAMDYTITATNQYGSSTTIVNLATDGIVSSTRDATANSIRVYTIAGQKIGIAGIENAHVTVYNQIGQQVFNAKVNGIVDQSFAKGIYIVKVGNAVSKVLIK